MDHNAVAAYCSSEGKIVLKSEKVTIKIGEVTVQCKNWTTVFYNVLLSWMTQMYNPAITCILLDMFS